jgi:hypothetical protein
MHILTPQKMDTLFLGVSHVVPRCILGFMAEYFLGTK